MSIGKIKAEFLEVCGEKEGYKITFLVKEDERDNLHLLLRELRKRNAMSEPRVLIEIQPYVCGAELNRSHFLWLLFEILSQARSVKANANCTARECFAEYMKSFGVEGVEATCCKKDFELVNKLIPTAIFTDESKTTFKVFPGIASLEPDRVAAVIDSVFDELILLGTIHDEDVQYLYNQWYQ